MKIWLDLNENYIQYWYLWDIKLTQGQGHKVKGQGQICNYTKDFVLALNHEQGIGFWW